MVLWVSFLKTSVNFGLGAAGSYSLNFASYWPRF